MDGLRGWKQGSSGQINYLYAGGVPVCEINGRGGVAAVNTWGPAGLLARQSGGMNTYYAWDALGNVAQTLSSGGSVTNTFSWDAYGKGVSTSGSSDPYSGFGGEWGYYTDHETTATLCGVRFYDSNAGRWVTRDPAGYGGGINLYAYCGNNPISGIDPSGLLPVDPFDDSPVADQDYTSDLNAGPHPGLEAGKQMTDHLLHTLCPFFGLLPGLTGQDLLGCPISPLQRVFETATGTLGALGAAGSLGELGGEAVSVGRAAEEASGVSRLAKEAGGAERVPHSYHYSSDPPESFTNGLLPDAATTPDGSLTAAEAKRGLGIPRPSYCYPVYPEPGTEIRGPTLIQPSTKYPMAGANGEKEFFFPKGTGMGTVGPPRTL